MNDNFWESISAPFEQITHYSPRIAAALIVLVISVFIGRALGRVIMRLLERAKLSRTHNLFFKNLAIWFCILLGIAIGLNILGLKTALAGFLAGSGVAAVIIGFAFKEIGENFLAGLFLAVSRTFNVGDYILSDTLEGEVREIELRYTHIRTVDGRDIYIPNSQIFNKPLTNYTRDGLRRPSFTVGIDYADDTGEARALMLSAISRVSGVLQEPEPVIGVAHLAPQFVELEVSFWIDTFEVGDQASMSRIAQEEALGRIRSDVMEACRRTLMDEGFTVSANVSNSLSVDLTRSREAKPPTDTT